MIMDNKNYICDVYVYSISNDEMIERVCKLYRNNTADKIGHIYLGGINNLILFGVPLQPGVLWGHEYVWFYKSNKRTAARVFQNDVLEKIKDYTNKINNIWKSYDMLSNYIT